MSQQYMGRSARSLNRSTYSSSTAASSGRLVKQSEPQTSRFQPCNILGVVISVGLILVGLVVTVIANWPGHSSSGFNSLEIIGPCILAAGGLVLLLTIAVMVVRNGNQKDIWQKKMIEAERHRASIWASRTTLDSGIKRVPSTLSCGDNSVFEEASLSGLPHINNVSYPQDTNTSYGQHSVYRIQTMPDTYLGGNHLNVPQQQKQRQPVTIQQKGTSSNRGRYQSNQPQQNGVKPHSQQVNYNQNPYTGTGLNTSIASGSQISQSGLQHQQKPSNGHPCTGTGINNSIVSGSQVNVPVIWVHEPVTNQQANLSTSYSNQEPPLARSSPSSSRTELKLSQYGAETSPVNGMAGLRTPQYKAAPQSLGRSTKQLSGTPQYNTRLHQVQQQSKLTGSPLAGMPDLGNNSYLF